jgi:hypothetical protein
VELETPSQIAWPRMPLALKASQCSATGCDLVVATQLETRPLCADHFLSVSMREMDARSICLNSKPIDTAAAADLRNFLADCIRQAETFSGFEEFAAGSYQARLNAILGRISQLNRVLRRSRRMPGSVPIWLRREDPRNTWEEETWTATLSRHGAGFVCRHAVEVNGRVVLCRRDKGNRVEARVVYSHLDSDGHRQIGIEFLGKGDFWDAAIYTSGAQ